MINGYPKSSGRGRGSVGRGPRPRPSGQPSPPPKLGFVGPIPAIPAPAAALAGGGSGAGGVIIRGAIAGGMRGAWSPQSILLGAGAGAILGYVAWEVANWSYAKNLMWMPSGWELVGRKSPACSQEDFARWNSSTTQTLGLPYFNPACTHQFFAGNNMGSGFVPTTHRTINLFRYEFPSHASYMVPAETWGRRIVGVQAVAPKVEPITYFDGWEIPYPGSPENLPIKKPVPTPKPWPGYGKPVDPATQPDGPLALPDPWPLRITIPAITSPLVEVPVRTMPGVIVTPPVIFPNPGTPTDPATPPRTDPGDPPAQPGTNPTPQPGTQPGPGTGPGTDPGTGPGSQPGTDPGTGGGTGPTAPPGSRTPPRRGDKERKINVKNVVHPGVHLALNFATEGLDFIGVLFDSIPKGCRRSAGVTSNRPSMNEKLIAIYHCFEAIPLAEVITNFLNNQFEDFVYGTIGRQVGRATRNLGITTGLNRAIRAAQEQADGENPQNPNPQLVYNDETGEFGLEWELIGYRSTQQGRPLDTTFGDVRDQRPRI